MNRRSIPRFDMNRSGSEELHRQGIGIVPFMHSVAIEPQRLEPHYHEFFQIFLLQGRAAVMHDFVDFDVDGSTIVFLSPGQVHSARPIGPLHGTTISFTQAFFDHHAPPPTLLFDFPFFFPAEERPWMTIPENDEHRLVETFAELQREFDAARPGAADILRALLQILLVRANRLFTEIHPPKASSRAARLMRQFHLEVERHFREWHSVPEYARVLGVTANHLHDVIREQTGQSAGEVIRNRRLLDAKRLLSHSDLTVSEIGYHLGFQDPSYFSRYFRRIAGVTPAEFREQIREKYQANSA